MSELTRLRQRIETLRQIGNPVPPSLASRLRKLTNPPPSKRAQRKKNGERLEKWQKVKAKRLKAQRRMFDMDRWELVRPPLEERGK